MITQQDIDDIFRNAVPTKGQVSMETLVLLQNVANTELKIDTSLMEYYYAISVKELIDENNAITQETLQELFNDGWSLDENKLYIIKYISPNGKY